MGGAIGLALAAAALRLLVAFAARFTTARERGARRRERARLHARGLGAHGDAVRRAARAHGAARARRGHEAGELPRRRRLRSAARALPAGGLAGGLLVHAADRGGADAAQLLEAAAGRSRLPLRERADRRRRAQLVEVRHQRQGAGLRPAAAAEGRVGPRSALGGAQLLGAARAVAAVQPALPDRGPAGRGGGATHARLPGGEPPLLRDDRPAPGARALLRGRRRPERGAGGRRERGLRAPLLGRQGPDRPARQLRRRGRAVGHDRRRRGRRPLLRARPRARPRALPALRAAAGLGCRARTHTRRADAHRCDAAARGARARPGAAGRPDPAAVRGEERIGRAAAAHRDPARHLRRSSRS